MSSLTRAGPCKVFDGGPLLLLLVLPWVIIATVIY